MNSRFSKNKTIAALALFLNLVVFGAPLATAYALPGVHCVYGGDCLIPCDGPDCQFKDLEQLAINLINYLILIAVPFAAIAFVYAGFQYITSGGNTGKANRAKSIFWNVGIGFVIILGAWLIVKAITDALLAPGFSPLN